MRPRLMVIVLVSAAAVGGGALLLARGSGRDTAQDIAGSLGLVDDPPFQVALSGPLWRDRTLTSEDGAPDAAYVTSDEELWVRIRGADGARVAGVELRVDGRRQRQVRPACTARRCPAAVGLVFEPRLDSQAAGDRRIQVIVRDPKAGRAGTDTESHVTTASFIVHVGRSLPLVREGEPVTAARVTSASSDDSARDLRTSALRVLSAERRRGMLDTLLARSRLRVRAAGLLTADGIRLGATLWIELMPQRRAVAATIPAYVPVPQLSGYRLQRVRVRAPMLRDLLVDVDLTRRRVIALEPGPSSQTTAWAPSVAPAPAGAGDED